MMLMLLGSCARKENPLKDALPVQVQREWRLHDTAEVPVEQVPEKLRKLGVKAAIVAHYEAGGTVTVRLYRIGPAAFEAMQTWHDAQAVGFYKDSTFGTVEAPTLGRQELLGFVQDLQQNLK